MIREECSLTKPRNPMSSTNSNWDKPVEDRLNELEDRIENLEINILQLFKSLLSLADPDCVKVEKEKEEDKSEPVINI